MAKLYLLQRVQFFERLVRQNNDILAIRGRVQTTWTEFWAILTPLPHRLSTWFVHAPFRTCLAFLWLHCDFKVSLNKTSPKSIILDSRIDFLHLETVYL